MSKQAYEEMISALDEREIGIVYHKYTWRTIGSWEIVVDTTPRRKIVWGGHLGQLKILNTIDGDSVAYWNYRVHWEGPEGYSPRTGAVLDALLSERNPRREVFEEAQRKKKEKFEKDLAEDLVEVPGFGGTPEAPAHRVYLLGGHLQDFNFAERQLAKRGELVAAMRRYEKRRFRFVVVVWTLAAIWFEALDFSPSFQTFFVVFFLIMGLFTWLGARQTRIGLSRLAEDRELEQVPTPKLA